MSSIKERIAALQKAGAGGAADTEKSQTPAPAPASAPASTPGAKTGEKIAEKAIPPATPTCCVCTKKVFKPEELQALGKIYHSACFTCSCPKGDGCGRSLKGGDYVEHLNTPYCKNCHAKLFGFKGVNVGLGASATHAVAAAPAPAAASASTSAAASAIKPSPAPVPAPSQSTASASPADEAGRMSRMHQAWMVDTLRRSGGKCSYGHLVEEGEHHQCDTVGALLKYVCARVCVCVCVCSWGTHMRFRSICLPFVADLPYLT
jgi:hypothetical protein